MSTKGSDTSTYPADNVLLVTFGENPQNDTNAYQALIDLGELDSQGQIHIEAATVISRDLDGQVSVKSQVGDDPWVGTASGGLIGLLIGIIGGPLGVLIGGTTGVLLGSLYDSDDIDDTESVLIEISKRVHPTRTALIAEVSERSPDVVDAAMARLGGDVYRQPVFEVENEIASAEEAQRKAKAAARKELASARAAKTKENAHAKVEELKSKLHHEKAGAAA